MERKTEPLLSEYTRNKIIHKMAEALGESGDILIDEVLSNHDTIRGIAGRFIKLAEDTAKDIYPLPLGSDSHKKQIVRSSRDITPGENFSYHGTAVGTLDVEVPGFEPSIPSEEVPRPSPVIPTPPTTTPPPNIPDKGKGRGNSPRFSD